MQNIGLGLSKAIVTKTADNDKDGCNLISVTTCADGLPMDNVPVLVDMAGKNYGRVVNLKKGDFVLLGYVGADPEQPVVLGSFYDPSKKPPLKIDGKGKNTLRYFQTATGLSIKVDDSKDKGGVSIVTKDKHKIDFQDGSEQFLRVMDKDGNISVKLDLKKGEIEVKCQKIDVTAIKEIHMKSGKNEVFIKDDKGVDIKSPSGNVVINANKIDEKTKADINLNAANVHVNAKSQFNAKANGTTSVTASGTLKLDAKGQLNASANGMVNVKSNGVTNIGGSLVKIG